MIYVEKVRIINKTYPGALVLKKGFEFACKDVNLLVGDQGCGKSTLLNLIQKNHTDIKISLSDYTIKKGVKTFFFDSEKDNPRIKDPELYSRPNGEDVGIGIGSALKSRFMSHGEVLQGFTITPIDKAKNCVIILDEPESGLSITNQFKLIKVIKKAVSNGCQFFIATHCYPLIMEFDVISLEHKKVMKGIDFVNSLKS